MTDTPISRPNTVGITAESSTWAILDDTSSDIEYRGDWVSITASPQMNRVGYFGPTYRDTLHSLTGRGSLAFQFNGTGVRLLGTIINKLGDSLGKTDCFVDGVSYETSIQADFEANNYPYCEILDLKDGQHTINMTVDVPSGRTAWIDQVSYIPSPSTDLSHLLLQVDDADPMIKYDSYWQDIVAARWTHSNGSRAIIEFAGTSLSWYGMWFAEDASRAESRASWTIDDDPDEHFITIPARPESKNPFLNELIFNVTGLAPARHNLTITHRSNSSTRPLYLDYLLIQRVSVPDLPPTTTPTVYDPGSTNVASSGNSTSSSGDSSIGLSTGAEIGIGIGAAVAVVLLASLSILFYRRYKPNEKCNDDRSILNQPPMSAVNDRSSIGNAGLPSFPSVASASNHLPSHPPSTHDTRSSNDLGGGQNSDTTEDLPRYSMHFAQGGRRGL